MWLKKELIWVVLVLCLSSMVESSESRRLSVVTVLVSPQTKIEVEVAVDDEDRARGLMFRKSLPADGGMLFVFPVLENHSFWMKNTLIPLDLIWLNESGEIVYFLTAEPCKTDPCPSYVPMQKAKYVLEVNAGFTKKHRLKLGDRLDFTLPSAQ